MPELPEVETVIRGLRQVLEGRTIASVRLRRKDLRLPFPKDFAARLKGKKVEGLSRRAKYILASIEGGDCLLVHLGMTGRFTVHKPSGQTLNLGEFYFEEGEAAGNGTHDHVIFGLDDGATIVYSDPRRFGVMDLFPASAVASHKLLRGIGVEPLGNDFNAEALAKAFRGKAAPLKAALLDQKIIAGLGNIYVCEALFRGALSPKRRAGTLARAKKTDPRLEALVRHIRDILNEAIEAGGSTLNDFAHTDGGEGSYQQRFAVYDREGEPCRRCAKPIKRIVQAGRSTFYCKACQK